MLRIGGACQRKGPFPQKDKSCLLLSPLKLYIINLLLINDLNIEQI